MPSVEENKKLWNDTFSWKRQGEEWSRYWGSAEMQWYASIFPRIYTYVPSATILEIAPGYGRWTHYLKDLAEKLMVVDLSEKCIEACKQRFSQSTHLEYYVNDGRSLAMIPDRSVDFVFSFDSLVHVEKDVLQTYLQQLAQKLKTNGVGVIHHSNLGEYAQYYRRVQKIFPWGKKFLEKFQLLDVQDHWRSYSVSAEGFVEMAKESGLCCIRQELVNWGSKHLIDCFSFFTRPQSKWESPLKVLRNPYFMQEAKNILRLSTLYDHSSGLKTVL